MDILRRLDRTECQITQYRLGDEGLLPVAQVVQEAATILERWSDYVVAINVSGKFNG